MSPSITREQAVSFVQQQPSLARLAARYTDDIKYTEADPGYILEWVTEEDFLPDSFLSTFVGKHGLAAVYGQVRGQSADAGTYHLTRIRPGNQPARPCEIIIGVKELAVPPEYFDNENVSPGNKFLDLTDFTETDPISDPTMIERVLRILEYSSSPSGTK